MSFATPLFLWVFLPVVLGLLLMAGPRRKNAVIAAVSVAFYAVGGEAFVLLLLASVVVNFAGGLLVEPAPYRSSRTRRRVLAAVVAADIGSLALWKYADPATHGLRDLLERVGVDSPVVSLALPIGISFFTFHQVSYVVDVYRGTVAAQRQLGTFLTYVAMFPQLVAGPIVRYKEIAGQLERPVRVTVDTILDGFPRFAWGLTKKVVIADSLAPVSSSAFDGSPADLTTLSAWTGVLAYTLQLYFDFSGYTDMALGLGIMLGLRLPENFARPYSALSVTDFWRRWHMSLSRWFRDYVYIPLGGNRAGQARTYRNLWLVFLLTGLWHGAGWTFLVWGAYHGALLMAERAAGVGRRMAAAAPAPALPGSSVLLRRCATMLLVMIGWVFFRSPDIGTARDVLTAMFALDGWSLTPAMDAVLTGQRMTILLLAAVVFVLPRDFVTGRFLSESPRTSAGVARGAVMTIGLAYSSVLVIAGTFSPFLYYQF